MEGLVWVIEMKYVIFVCTTLFFLLFYWQNHGDTYEVSCIAEPGFGVAITAAPLSEGFFTGFFSFVRVEIQPLAVKYEKGMIKKFSVSMDKIKKFDVESRNKDSYYLSFTLKSGDVYSVGFVSKRCLSSIEDTLRPENIDGIKLIN